MKKFKDLINEVSVKWFQTMVKDKFSEFSKSPQFDMLNTPLLTMNKAEYNVELDRVYAEIKLLENYADILGYVKMNKIDINDGLDVKKLQEVILSNGLKSLPNLLVKIQLGTISELSERFFNEVRMWQDKIGRETEISEVETEDFKYLINVSLNKFVAELNEQVNSKKEVMDEIGEEIKGLGSNNVEMSQKRQYFTIIKIYFNKFRSELLTGLPTSVLEQDQQAPAELTKKIQELEAINTALNLIEFVLDFGGEIEHHLEK